MDGTLGTTEANDLSSFEDVERAFEGVLGVSMSIEFVSSSFGAYSAKGSPTYPCCVTNSLTNDA